MLFWILASLCLIIALLCMVLAEESAIGGFIGGLIVSAIVCGMVLGVVQSVTWSLGWGAHEYKAQREQLKAVAAASSIHGEFFLGSGYIGSERAVNYVASAGGQSFLRQLPASKSVIIEDTPKEQGPYKITLCESYDNPWVLPWAIERESDKPVKYEFHIPPGSVTGDFTIDNSK